MFDGTGKAILYYSKHHCTRIDGSIIMKEIQLRKWHRIIGMIFGVLFIFQVFSGIVLSIENIAGAYWGGIIHDSHEGFGTVGNFYRIVLGTLLVWMVVSGSMIAFKIRSRLQKKQIDAKSD